MVPDPLANLFFKDFSPQGRETLLAAMIYVDYTDGQFLFHENDPGDYLCLVLSGQVMITKSAQGKEVVLNQVRAGDFFGEVAVLDGGGRSSAAYARGAVLLGKLPKKDILRALDEEPIDLTIGLFKKVLHHLRSTNNLFVQQLVHKEKMQLVGEMANSLIHDFRNPIAGICVAAENLKLEHTDEASQRWCSIIQLQSNRLIDMTRELLDFSRGDSRLSVEATTLSHVIELTVSLLADYVAEANVELILEIEPVEVDLDLLRILRVLQNLITNAVEALENRIDPKIIVRGWSEGDFALITVTDNGPGIPEEIRASLFEPFVTHGKSSGTGLGMAIVQSIITAHKGTITFESSAESGTTFLITLPRVKV